MRKHVAGTPTGQPPADQASGPAEVARRSFVSQWPLVRAFRSIRVSGAVLISLYLLLALAMSQVMPFNKGPDEGIQLDYIKFIAVTGRLPITYEERDLIAPRANWPALYHLMLAYTSRLFNIDVAGPPQIKIFRDSFRYRAMDIQMDDPGYLHTEDQEWPYYGQVLVLHLGRWVSILFSLLTLCLVYRIILDMRPDRPWLALLAAALLAFIPTFMFVGSALNEDALVALLAALYFWLLIRIIKQPDKSRLYVGLGLVLGLSITAKYTTVVLPLEALPVIWLIGRERGYSWRWRLERGGIVCAGMGLASAWWFGWNFWFLNEVKQRGLVAGLLRPIFTGGTDVTLARIGNFLSGGQIGLTDLPENTSVGTFGGWLQNTFLSFWGVTIGGITPFYPYAYLVVGLLLGVAAWGLWRLWRGQPAQRQWLLLLSFHLTIFLILPLIRFGLSRRLGQTAQGRHVLIPAAAAIVALLVWGLAAAIPSRWQRWLFPALVLGLVVWVGAHLVRLDAYMPPPLPLRTVPQAAAWLPYPANAGFSDPFQGKVELVSYDIRPQPEQGLLNLDLAWRSVAASNQSYVVGVTVRDAAGRVVSHWQGYNGGGRVPSLAWVPGDSVFDRLALPLPSLPAGIYIVEVGVTAASGPLEVSRQPGQRGDQPSQTVRLTSFSLDWPATLALSRRVTVAGPAGPVEVAFEVWGPDGPAKSQSPDNLPHYRYPATITLITSGPLPDQAEFRLQLVDGIGRVWPATRSEGGIHTFIIGPRWSSGEYRLQAELLVHNQTFGPVTTGPLLVVENWWPRRFDAPGEIAVSAQANFANQLMLLGYTLRQRQVKAGAAFPITLYWQAPAKMAPQADFVQFNHLLDGKGVLRGGYDRRPLEYYSTLLWAPGEVVVDGYAVPVDADAPPGEYYLNVGYYLTVGQSAVNLPLVVDGQMTDTSSVTIGPIEVVAP